MSLKPTIFKAHLNIADIDHNHYQDHAITMARHPSETDERMMVRLAAYALQAHQLQDLCGGDGKLEFGKGLSDPDEPDVLLTDFTDAKRLWVEVGQPDDKPMAKACSKADSVVVYRKMVATVCLPDRCIGKLVFTCIVISRRYHIFNRWLACVAHGAEQSGGKFEGRVKSKSIK